MSSPYADLDRPPLSGPALQTALAPEWDVRVVQQTASTNADVAAEARAGAAEGLVVVAEQQTAGRGRLDRGWSAPARSGLTFSLLLRPGDVPVSRWGWLPLLAGTALAEAVADRTGLDVRLKWPNDLLAADGGKLAGVLAEVVDDAVVVGVGLNVTTRRDELAGLPGATSLGLAGAESPDRDPLLRSILRTLAALYERWRSAGGAAVSSYAPRCGTIGAKVRVELPGGGVVVGTATAIDADGRLVVRDETGGPRALAAGDVVHLR